jgi:ribosomal protein L6P/L9E
VTVEVKARQVRVKGPRGVLTRDFKHLSVDMYLIEEDGQKKLKVRGRGGVAVWVFWGCGGGGLWVVLEGGEGGVCAWGNGGL